MTSAAKLHFLDLPPELLIQILLEVDWEDFLRLKLVCKAIRDLTNTSEIQYRICLGALGYQTTLATPKYPASDQLDKFQKLTKGFLTGHFTKKESIPIQGFTPTYELQGGSFIQGRHAPNNPRDTVGINVFRFATFLNDEPTTQWQLPNFPRVVRDLTLDPSQDLLAAIVDKTPDNQQ
ncbi:1217_t:CDS:1 [Acaulospora colombiana]|uniref:1217_t:CDS:1 n=1 Tax=Acaulospora colombiana TaxID=27376 RepID=A0ACA9NZU9_9GLOM|nr:1217_t:CDS:1 [Acaulospora colombiana]